MNKTIICMILFAPLVGGRAAFGHPEPEHPPNYATTPGDTGFMYDDYNDHGAMMDEAEDWAQDEYDKMIAAEKEAEHTALHKDGSAHDHGGGTGEAVSKAGGIHKDAGGEPIGAHGSGDEHWADGTPKKVTPFAKVGEPTPSPVCYAPGGVVTPCDDDPIIVATGPPGGDPVPRNTKIWISNPATGTTIELIPGGLKWAECNDTIGGARIFRAPNDTITYMLKCYDENGDHQTHSDEPAAPAPAGIPDPPGTPVSPTTPPSGPSCFDGAGVEIHCTTKIPIAIKSIMQTADGPECYAAAGVQLDCTTGEPLEAPAP